MQTTIRNLRQENNYYYDRLDRISKQVHQQELLKEKDICAPIQSSIFNMPNKTTSMAKSKLLQAGMLTNPRSTERVEREPSTELIGYGFDENDNTSRQEKLSSKEKDNLAKTSEFASRAKIGLANDSLQPFAHTTGRLELFAHQTLWKLFISFILGYRARNSLKKGGLVEKINYPPCRRNLLIFNKHNKNNESII